MLELLVGCLLAVVLLAGLLVWDNARMFARVAKRGRWENRRRQVMAERAARVSEDAAWAEGRAQAEKDAILFALIRQNIQTVDQLAASLDEAQIGHSVRVVPLPDPSGVPNIMIERGIGGGTRLEVVR